MRKKKEINDEERLESACLCADFSDASCMSKRFCSIRSKCHAQELYHQSTTTLLPLRLNVEDNVVRVVNTNSLIVRSFSD